MKLRNGFVIKDYGDKKYAVATGDAAKHFRGVLDLNELGAFIFGQLMTETDESAIADAVMDEYNAERTTVLSDINLFIRQLRSADLIVD